MKATCTNLFYLSPPRPRKRPRGASLFRPQSQGRRARGAAAPTPTIGSGRPEMRAQQAESAASTALSERPQERRAQVLPRGAESGEPRGGAEQCEFRGGPRGHLFQ